MHRIHNLKWAALAWAALSCAPASMAAESAANPSTMEFASGGTIDMDLHAGEVEVVGTQENKIVVSYRIGDGGDVRPVEIALRKTSDRAASVHVNGPSNHFSYRVQVPERSHVHIRMTAGDLTVSRIRGDQDVALRAGNLMLRIGDPDAYARVHGSVTAGELDARPWRVDKGGVARSFDREGSGALKLTARVMAGNLSMRSGD